jgi:SAM-dependent methyltransferase
VARAPHNGDEYLQAREAREYFRFAWGEIRTNREPDGIEQSDAEPVDDEDIRSPFRIYAERRLREAIAEFARSPVKVLDIGCGPGGYASLFRHVGGTYEGLDIAEHVDWPERTRRRPAGLDVRFHCMRAEAVGDLPATYNFSISSSALEHVDDPDAAVRGLWSRTEPGSIGIHVVPAPWSVLAYGAHGWRRFSAAQLKELFESSGFETVHLYRLGGLPSLFLTTFWIAGLETGWALQSLTFSMLPYPIYQFARRLRLPFVRTGHISGSVYRFLLRAALRLDRSLQIMPLGYAIVVRRTS